MDLTNCNDNNIVADRVDGYTVVCYVGKPIVWCAEYIKVYPDGGSLCVWQTLNCQRTE